MAARGEFSSRFGFIMAAAGSAVGLGNVWGFPTNAAENGGGAFVLIYFVLAFLLAYPALMAELIIGRHTQSNIATALGKVSSGTFSRLFGRFTGLYGIVVAALILSFYSIVAGWMVAFMLEPVATVFNWHAAGDWLTNMSVERNLLFTLFFAILTLSVISGGVENGIEKWSSRLMPSLLVLLLALIVYVLFQDGAIEGLKTYLVPDFSQAIHPALIVDAMGQAFFSLSLGVGTMLIYGSYISKKENLPKLGAIVTLVDISIAFFAGLLVIPAMFVAQHNGVEIFNNGNLIAGPGLIFDMLPKLFETMGPVGLLIAFTFFALMSIAALTSSISMLEVPVAYTVERHGMARKKASWVIGLAVFLISAAIIFSFDPVFDWVVDLTTKYSEPLVGLVICVYAGWVLNRNKLLQELKIANPEVEKSFFWKVWPMYVKVFCPLLIAAIFVYTVFMQ